MLDLVNILEGLHSSSLQIIHRDIKPSNIMINNDDILKLIDFDISRIHKSDQSTDTNILGTYGYAAPEQFGFNQSDIRTEIYSIGVTMNKLLTGKFPIEELYKGNLSKIISKCIELDPKNRFQDIEELKKALLRQKEKSMIKNKPHDNFKLPGFRSKNPFFMVISGLWYIILVMTLLGLFTEEQIPEDRISDILIVSFFFILTLFYGNYRDIKSKIPMTRSKNILIKILGHILYPLLLFIILGLILP